MKVRRMADADKPRWLELRKALWPDCPAERHALEMDPLQRSDGVVFLAQDSDGQVVGLAEVSIRRDHVEGTSSAPVPYLKGWYVVPFVYWLAPRPARAPTTTTMKTAESRAGRAR